MERPLLDHYHAALGTHSVSGYERSDLHDDYRMSVLWQLMTPVWQAALDLLYLSQCGPTRALVSLTDRADSPGATYCPLCPHLFGEHLGGDQCPGELPRAEVQ